MTHMDDCREAYDRVADEYVRRIFGELEHKPFDRAWLDRFAAEVAGVGPVCDLGCGPGHVARYLSERGVKVVGFDLSPAMVERARLLTPEVDFEVGDFTALDPQRTWSGLVAFYSLIHVAREFLPETLRGLYRALLPGAPLTVAFHIGDSVLHLDEWWGTPVSVDFHFFTTDAMIAVLRDCGFDVVEAVERDPYPDIEHPSRRAYIDARRPQ
ncbi:MAG: trans-aconitate 2-methyltransferase [Planctomycetota bacterium]